MYLAIDIGGTKTLLGVFSADGKIQQTIRFETSKKYPDFLTALEDSVAKLTTKDFSICAVGVPGILDRKRGIAIAFGNLDWRNKPIEADIEAIVKAPVLIENDAKLAGLSEAKLLTNDFEKVLYVTISTGIGVGLITNGVINADLSDAGGKTMLLEHDGKLQPWEDFASGKAIVKRFGKQASEIDDPDSWKIITQNIAVGLLGLIALLQPDVVIIGGGVGTHFDKFGQELAQTLKKYETPMMPIPPLKKASRPEEAVLYGCFELARNHSKIIL